MGNGCQPEIIQEKPFRRPMKHPHNETITSPQFKKPVFNISEYDDESNETTSSESSEHNEKPVMPHDTISTLIFHLIDDDVRDSNSHFKHICEHVHYMDNTELQSFWNEHGDILLPKIKSRPDSCIELRMHELPQTHKEKLSVKLGIMIFKYHQDEALILLSENINKIAILLKNTNMKQANFLLYETNKEKILRQAYECQKQHKTGFAYVLFKKAGQLNALQGVLDRGVKDYVKLLIVTSN